MVDMLFAQTKDTVFGLEAWTAEIHPSATTAGVLGDLAAVTWTNFRPEKNRTNLQKTKIGLLGRFY